MSASNWQDCPKCKQSRTGTVAEAAKLYGQVSAEDYETAMIKARNAELPQQTLREDYEFYVEGFCLNISYGCRCDNCGFQFSYNKKIEMPHQECQPKESETNEDGH